MKKEKLEILEEYLKSGITTILLENIPATAFSDAIVLESSCSLEDLNGHYEGIEFLPPKWYSDLMNQSEKQSPILIINNINKVSNKEQTKFIEILKYKKVSTFELPKKCIIILLVTNLKENKINEEVYSLVAHI